jgi:hypothetical protein
MADKPTIPRTSSRSKKGPPPMGKKGGPPPMSKKAGSGVASTDPLKRSVAILKSAGVEAAAVKEGDESRKPEALRLYTEGLTLLQEAVASGSYNEKICDSLNKKAKGVRKRIKELGGKAPAAAAKKSSTPSKSVAFTEDTASPPASPGTAGLTPEEMAEEVATWTGQTAKALKASPVHSSIELTGKREANCTKGDVYTVVEAGHHKGKLTL